MLALNLFIGLDVFLRSSERRWRNSDVITTLFARMMSPWVNYVTIPQPLITAVLWTLCVSGWVGCPSHASLLAVLSTPSAAVLVRPARLFDMCRPRRE